MGKLVHFYSAPSGSVGDYLSGPDVTGSARAKETGAIGIRTQDLQDFDFQLKNLKNLGIKIERMVIETHGSPGALYFGNDSLDSTSLVRLKGKGYEELFEENARIFLNGCNIAESECSTGTCGPAGNGRKFLLDLARLFLFKGGGRVGASTSKGIPFFNNKVYHLWGTTMYAYISKGGAKTRIAVGTELATPEGQWKVTLDNNEVEFYWFNRSGSIKWNDGSSFGGKSGKGTWATIAGQVQVKWESGSQEKWDLPLFTQEQPATWYRKDGSVSAIQAEKIIDSDRLID